MRAIIYLRKSTDDNRHQKASIDDQRSWSDHYIEELRARGEQVEVVKVYEEKRTAKEPGRPLFGEMMGNIYAGRADSIITWDIDRLSRNEVDEGTLKWAIRQGKLKQVLTHNSVYTEHELLTMGIFLSLGAEEIAKMRQRVMRRMTAMITEGKVPYRAPYGYKNVEGGMVVLDESESIVLRKIFKHRQDGWSYLQICDELNSSGIKTRGRGRETDSGKWKETQIEHILKNDFYVGVVRFAGNVGNGIHDQIISRDLWDEVNEKNRTNVGYRFHNFPLKGIVVDPDGKPLKASLVKGKFVYYHNDHHKISVSQKKIFDACKSIAEQWKMPPELLPLAREELVKFISSENKAVFAELDEVRKRQADNENRLSRLVDLFMDGKINEDAYGMKHKECLDMREKLNKDVETLEALSMTLKEKFDRLVKLLETLSQSYESLNDTDKGIILKSALVKLVVDKEKTLQIEQKEVFEHLLMLNFFNWQRWLESNLVEHNSRVSNFFCGESGMGCGGAVCVGIGGVWNVPEEVIYPNVRGFRAITPLFMYKLSDCEL